MNVSKIQITRLGLQDKGLTIPVQLNWSLLDTENEIREIEADIVEQVAGKGFDFETNRFSHSGYTSTNVNDLKVRTDVNYEFYFFTGGTLTSSSQWRMDYRDAGFTTDEVYYFRNSFKKSFFKLDFYDSPSESTQKNYLTIILPTTKGTKMVADMQGTVVDINKPKYILDFVGDRDGFFIYWLKSREYIDISRFYMSCKFWNAKTGVFTRMINRPQSLQVTDSFSPNNLFNFYYQVNLNYPTQKYNVYDTITFDRVGTTQPIKWYEYVNP